MNSISKTINDNINSVRLFKINYRRKKPLSTLFELVQTHSYLGLINDNLIEEEEEEEEETDEIMMNNRDEESINCYSKSRKLLITPRKLIDSFINQSKSSSSSTTQKIDTALILEPSPFIDTNDPLEIHHHSIPKIEKETSSEVESNWTIYQDPEDINNSSTTKSTQSMIRGLGLGEEEEEEEDINDELENQENLKPIKEDQSFKFYLPMTIEQDDQIQIIKWNSFNGLVNLLTQPAPIKNKEIKQEDELDFNHSNYKRRRLN
ncbi:hypothetical protein CROQUDRAFT_99250 [Cronartium quercuum f. sp. fusiforme G11]|uniref:Uncharacterized protein n=1 Tax=Cronartium quercuum f. sp. fusiforme G11 TaxID=708437 RepID=A0A9P6NC26_9BASI|nr:hypothetical protein CROQUDRAFT_99250 [Cronartium quercuum f. sp. fusiforme G11]